MCYGKKLKVKMDMDVEGFFMELKKNVKLKRVNSYIRFISLYDKEELEQAKKVFDRKCKKCGYTNRVINKSGKIPCKNCGTYVFISDEEEFKYRIKEELWKKKVI